MDMKILAMAETERRRKPFNLMEHPYLDVVFDSCHRNAGQVIDAANIKLDSGHSWGVIPVASGNPTVSPVIRYNSRGVLEFNGGANRYDSPMTGWLVEDFASTEPSLHIKFDVKTSSNQTRMIYLKFINAENWIAIQTSPVTVYLLMCVEGVTTSAASFGTWGAGSYLDAPMEIKSVFKLVHISHFPNAGSGRALFISVNGKVVIEYGITTLQWQSLSAPGKVGIGSPLETNVYAFKAGRSIT